MRTFIKTAAVVAVVMAVYFIWSSTGRKTGEYKPDIKLEEVLELGRSTSGGNIVGIQAYMEIKDYASEKNFYTKINSFMEKVLEKGFIKDKTVVVFPEYIGTFLVLVSEKAAIFNEDTLEKAMTIMALSNIFSFLKELVLAPDVKEKPSYSLFKLKSSEMAEVYNSVFSQVAKKYGVTLVAGSIVLSEPEIAGNSIVTGDGKLYNSSFVYDSNGKLYKKIIKKSTPFQMKPGLQIMGQLKRYRPLIHLWEKLVY